MNRSREASLQKARQAEQATLTKELHVIQTKERILKQIRSWKTDVPMDCIAEALEEVAMDLIGGDAWEDRIMKNAAQIHGFWWSQRKGWNRSPSQPARAPQ